MSALVITTSLAGFLLGHGRTGVHLARSTPMPAIVMTEQPQQSTASELFGKIEVQTSETLTVTLEGCQAKGIGVGLDPNSESIRYLDLTSLSSTSRP